MVVDLPRFDAVATAIGRQIEHGIAIWEAVRPAQIDHAVQERFADTDAGNTFVALRQAALWQVSLITSRLWDQAQSTSSLLQAYTLLRRHPALVSAIADRSRSLNANEIQNTTRRFFQLRNKHLAPHLEALKAFRDSRLAHWQTFEDEKRKNLILSNRAELSNMVWCLSAALAFGTPLQVFSNSGMASFRDIRRIRRRYAKAFWSIPLRAERLDSD
jgi:hypothetical protein